MTYEDLVERGVSTLLQADRNNWELAHLTHTATTGEDAVTLDRWAEDVRTKAGRRFSRTTAARYREMYVRFALERTAGERGEELPTWSEAWVEMIPRDAGPAMRARQVEIHFREASPERKAELATTLLGDPEVAAAATDTSTPRGRRTYALREEHDRQVAEEARERARETERRDAGDPVVRRLSEQRAVQDLTGVYADAATRAAGLLRVIRDLPREGDDPLADRVFLTEAIARLRATITATEDLLAGRAQGVDAFFASVLQEAKG